MPMIVQTCASRTRHARNIRWQDPCDKLIAGTMVETTNACPLLRAKLSIRHVPRITVAPGLTCVIQALNIT